MKSRLVDQSQPFGHIENHTTQRGEGRPAEHHNRMASETEIHNHGTDKVHSFADKNPNAYREACNHRDNPFHWTGHPKK